MDTIRTFFCFLCISFVFSLSAGAQEKVDLPELKIGDRWVFRAVNLFNNEETSRYEQKVTGVNGDAISLEQTTTSSKSATNVGRTTKMKADRATWTFSNSRIFDGKMLILAFPLEVGKTWKTEWKWNRADSGTTSFQGVAKVEGWEDVQVPAGKFRTLRVVHDNGYTAQQSGQSWSGLQSETLWYSPEVKRFVRREFIDGRGGDRILTELTEYSAN